MTDSRSTPLRLAYYADDFTGATDALEQLESSGFLAALFLAPPTPERLASYTGLAAVGIAGRTRSLPTDEIEGEVRPALEALRSLGAAHVHYKVCSTFDSSPTVGSIGRVIDVASQLFDGPFVPLVVGAPGLGRWCVFGNLFASYGIGAQTEAHRLDRHPSMSRHPVTPADESDLRVHLGRQTDKRVALIDVRTLSLPIDHVHEALAAKLETDELAIVLFDCLDPSHLEKIGAAIDRHASPEKPLFSVGSSAIESALSAHWQATLASSPRPAAPPIEGPLLVLAGSCSPVTAEQVENALAAGFAGVSLDASRLAGEGWLAAANQGAAQAAASLATAPGVVVSTNLHGSRPEGSALLDAERLGAAMGVVHQACRQQGPIGLTVVAGGDTASYTARAIGVESLAMAAPLTPGAPVCRVGSVDREIDGSLFVFKGGQVGRPDLFASLLPQFPKPTTS